MTTNESSAGLGPMALLSNEPLYFSANSEFLESSVFHSNESEFTLLFIILILVAMDTALKIKSSLLKKAIPPKHNLSLKGKY